MLFRKKGLSILLGVVFVFSNFSFVMAADHFEKQQNIDHIEATFHKQSFTPTNQDHMQNTELKNSIVSPEKLGAKGKGLDKRGFIPVGWQPGDSFGEPSGTNNISFSAFDYGDILLIHDGWVAWGYYRHAGMWDSDYYSGSIYDACVWEANKTPTEDVHRTTPDKFRHYDEAVGLWVPDASYTERYNTTWFAYDQDGEPYNALSSKSNYDEWYCSKLVWAAYKEKANIDLDVDGGYSVLPDDIYQDNQAYVFAYSD